MTLKEPSVKRAFAGGSRGRRLRRKCLEAFDFGGEVDVGGVLNAFSEFEAEGQEVRGCTLGVGRKDVGMVGGNISPANRELFGANVFKEGTGKGAFGVLKEGSAAAKAREVNAFGIDGFLGFANGVGISLGKFEGGFEDGDVLEAVDGTVGGGEGGGLVVADEAVGGETTEFNDVFPDGVAVGASIHGEPTANGARDAIHIFEASVAAFL